MKLQTSLSSGSSTVYELNVQGDDSPTKSPFPTKPLWKRLLCFHSWKFLYQTEIMFFQERVGWTEHYGCQKCGATRSSETE